MTLLLAVLTVLTAWAQNVTYLEYNTTTKTFDSNTCSTYTTVADQTEWTTGWYVVSGEVTIESRISVTGDVHLILSNGATLSAPKGIACVEGNSLTIYGQSNDESTMGVLNAGQGVGTSDNPDYNYAAIGGGGKSGDTSMSPVNGTITIHGGKICPKAHAYAAAIGGGKGDQNNRKDFGTIVINGGIINADGTDIQCPAVIGGGTYMKRGDITINGGTITITVGNYSQGALIGAGVEAPCGHITINGGEITAVQPTGSMAAMGSCIGGGVFMTIDDYTDPDLDQIVITGGTITATATYAGAAIGGGQKGKCGSISISGGTINASAVHAAAIGNGNGIKADGGSIAITGGVINATSGRSPIGASQAGYGPAISISSTDAENDRVTLTPTGTMPGLGGSSVTIADGANVTDVIKLAAEGFSTYYASQWDLTLPAGMIARIVTAAGDGGKLTYETIADGDTETKNVPGGTAVLLQTAAANAAQSLTVGLASKTTYSGSSNLLQGSDVAVTTTGDGKHYKLSYNTDGTDIGWYWGADDGAAFTSGAHKAWLVLPSAGGNDHGNDVNDPARKFIGLPDWDEATGISSLTSSLSPKGEGSGYFYTLDGRKLDGKPTRRGIYVNKGRKVIIK